MKTIATIILTGSAVSLICASLFGSVMASERLKYESEIDALKQSLSKCNGIVKRENEFLESLGK